MLCDGCPRAFHMACLDVALGDLPEAEWTCPKVPATLPYPSLPVCGALLPEAKWPRLAFLAGAWCASTYRTVPYRNPGALVLSPGLTPS